MTDEQVFLHALELADPAARAAFLDKACAGDPAFRKRVEGLLAAHFQSGEFLDQPLTGRKQASAPNLETDNTVTSFSPVGGAAKTAREGEDEDNDLSFLKPSTRPDSLGRIGHYEVLELLGRGGFGIVFRAYDEVLQRVVALKVLAPVIAATSPARKRFLREARSSAQVRHDNVIQVFGVEEQPLPYLVMEFIPGETLQQRLDRTGPLDAAEVVRFGRQIAEGLAAAHAAGLVHRDIKPGNVLIEAGGQERVKITDFGLARTADDASLTQSGLLAGTPLYMAPEQAKGETLDHRADLFSLGSLMYVLATGRPPFRAATTFAVLKRVVEDNPRPPREVIPELPQWLCDVIAKLHAKDPEDRFQSASEVAEVLARGDFQSSPGNLVGKKIVSRPSKSRFWKVSFWILAGIWADLTAVAALLVLKYGFLNCWRYVSNRSDIEILANAPHVQGLVIEQDGWLVEKLKPGVIKRSLPPGDYQFRVELDPGYQVSKGTIQEKWASGGGNEFTENASDNAVSYTLTRGGRAQISFTFEPTPNEAAQVERPKGGVANFLGMRFMIINPGNFMMGSSKEDIDRDNEKNKTGPAIFQMKHEGPQHIVELTRPFVIGSTEVTVGQFQKFLDENPTYVLADKDWKKGSVNNPATRVSWQNAMDFCKWLSKREGRTYRLPTEAEWEYCCRAGGKDQRFSFGDKEEKLGEYGWFGTNSGYGVHDVATRKPNAWGLYDMHGNAWEWCLDVFDPDYYQQSPFRDPRGPKEGPGRVARGGSVTDEAVTCRSATRIGYPADFSSPFIGFRVVQVAGPDPIDKPEPNKAAVPVPEPANFPDKTAAEYVLGIGGTVRGVSYGRPFTCKQKSDLPPGMFELQTVDLANNKLVDDEGLAALKDCRTLVSLDLYGTKVTDAGILHLRNLQGLAELNLAETKVGDAGMAAFKDCVNLRGLWLTNTRVTGAGLQEFKKLPYLERLGLAQTRVTDASLALFAGSKNLKGVDLSWTKITDKGLAHFKDCRELTGLWLGRTGVGNAGLVTNAGLRFLENCKKLEELQLSGTQVDSDGLKILKQFPSLKKLLLDKTPVTDLTPLAGMKLETLELRGSKVIDLKPISEMPLKDIRCDFQASRDKKILKSIPTLELINDRPAEEFWREVGGKD